MAGSDPDTVAETSVGDTWCHCVVMAGESVSGGSVVIVTGEENINCTRGLDGEVPASTWAVAVTTTGRW